MMERFSAPSPTSPMTVHSTTPGQPIANTYFSPANLDQTLMHRPVWPWLTSRASGAGRAGLNSMSPRVFSGAASTTRRAE